MEARNFASRDSIGLDDVIKAVRERHNRRFGHKKNGFNAGHADHGILAGGGRGGRGKGGGGGAHGKRDRRGKGKRGRRKHRDEAVKAPTRMMMARPRLSVAMAEASKPMKVVPLR